MSSRVPRKVVTPSLRQVMPVRLPAEDRAAIRAACEEAAEDRIVITHGTDTMTKTAEALGGIEGKSIVLTGSLAPARFRETDAVFNIGFGLAAAQAIGPGVYIAMNGRVFTWDNVRKNKDAGVFEELG